MLDILVCIGLVALIFPSSSTNSTKAQPNTITFKKALSELKKLNGCEIGAGKIEISAVKNANIYFIKNSKNYYIQYFCDKQNNPSRIRAKSIDKSKSFNSYLKTHKLDFSKINEQKTFDKYIDLLKHYCKTI